MGAGSTLCVVARIHRLSGMFSARPCYVHLLPLRVAVCVVPEISSRKDSPVCLLIAGNAYVALDPKYTYAIIA